MQARIVYRSRCYRGDMNLPGRHSPPPRSDTFIKTECTEIHHQHHIGQALLDFHRRYETLRHRCWINCIHSIDAEKPLRKSF